MERPGRTREALQALNETLDVYPERIDACSEGRFLASMEAMKRRRIPIPGTIEIDPESMNAARSWTARAMF
jgi:hypothetical protein